MYFSHYKTSFDLGNSLRDDHHDAHGILQWRMKNRDFFHFFIQLLYQFLCLLRNTNELSFCKKYVQCFHSFFINLFHFQKFYIVYTYYPQKLYERHDTFNFSSNMKTKYHHFYDFMSNNTFNTSRKKLHKNKIIEWTKKSFFLLHRDCIRIIRHYGWLKCYFSSIVRNLSL